jgi:hypothetical protein
VVSATSSCPASARETVVTDRFKCLATSRIVTGIDFLFCSVNGGMLISNQDPKRFPQTFWIFILS